MNKLILAALAATLLGTLIGGCASRPRIDNTVYKRSEVFVSRDVVFFDESDSRCLGLGYDHPIVEYKSEYAGQAYFHWRCQSVRVHRDVGGVK